MIAARKTPHPSFAVITNDGEAQNSVWLMGAKKIFATQLPKMPREYIVRLVMDRKHKTMVLLKDGKKIARYVYERMDPKDRERTYKPFHHVYQVDWKGFLTKGPGGRYTHHRGIYFGFSKCSAQDKNGKKEYKIKGVFLQSNIKNRNGRVYPKEILMKED